MVVPLGSGHPADTPEEVGNGGGESLVLPFRGESDFLSPHRDPRGFLASEVMLEPRARR